jgi:hypothetical protein
MYALVQYIIYVIHMFYIMMVHSSRNSLNLINILVKHSFKEWNLKKFISNWRMENTNTWTARNCHV